MTESHDPFSARRTIDTPLGERVIYRLDALSGLGDVEHLPYSIKVLLESALRNHDGRVVTDGDVHAVARFDATAVLLVLSSKTSPVSLPWLTLPRCVPPLSG